MNQPLDPKVVRKLIQDTLIPLNLYSTGIEELLLFTCANESNLGMYRTQMGGGPARGIFQVEGATFNDVFINFLNYHDTLKYQISNLFHVQPPCVDELVNNDQAAVAICRMQYYRAPEPIPAPTDLDGIWALYKLRYNTPQGAATQSGAMAAYKKYVLGQ